jgi:branched-chain amino acid transport system ATP-binding protein
MFPILKDKLDSQAGTLSGGQRQMLAMAMAIIRKPEIMMFDEPTASLAPKIATQILQQIISLRDKSKITIILAEQNAKSALEIGDNALLLVSGQLTFDGKASELLNHEELGKLYLGIGST